MAVFLSLSHCTSTISTGKNTWLNEVKILLTKRLGSAESCALYNYGTTAHINFDDELNGKE